MATAFRASMSGIALIPFRLLRTLNQTISPVRYRLVERVRDETTNDLLEASSACFRPYTDPTS